MRKKKYLGLCVLLYRVIVVWGVFSVMFSVLVELRDLVRVKHLLTGRMDYRTQMGNRALQVVKCYFGLKPGA